MPHDSADALRLDGFDAIHAASAGRGGAAGELPVRHPAGALAALAAGTCAFPQAGAGDRAHGVVVGDLALGGRRAAGLACIAVPDDTSGRFAGHTTPTRRRRADRIDRTLASFARVGKPSIRLTRRDLGQERAMVVTCRADSDRGRADPRRLRVRPPAHKCSAVSLAIWSAVAWTNPRFLPEKLADATPARCASARPTTRRAIRARTPRPRGAGRASSPLTPAIGRGSSSPGSSTRRQPSGRPASDRRARGSVLCNRPSASAVLAVLSARDLDDTCPPNDNCGSVPDGGLHTRSGESRAGDRRSSRHAT